MPRLLPTVFAFSACYIGDTNSSAVLTQVNAIRSQGARISEDYPTEFLVYLGNYAQSGDHTVNVTLQFINEDPLTWVLAQGASITAGNINVPPPPVGNPYALVLLSPNAYEQSSWYFPAINSTGKYDVQYTKDHVRVLSVEFNCASRDWNTNLTYQDTQQNIASYLGSRSPF